MDEYTSPLLEAPATTGNLSDIVALNAAAAPDKVTFRRRSGDRWLDVSCRDFQVEVTAVARA